MPDRTPRSPISFMTSSLLLLLLCTPATAKTLYVSGTGNDANDGSTKATAFRTLQKAADLTVPGDTVMAMNGTYSANPKQWVNAVLHINNSGTPDKPITYTNYPSQHPIVTTANSKTVAYGIMNFGSYVNINGFEVTGGAKNVTLAQATALYQAEEKQFQTQNKFEEDWYTNQVGISTENTAHVRITHNLVHDFAASGINVQKADYTLVEKNVVFDTSWWTVFDTSGINFHSARNTDNDTTVYHNFILNNVSHNNGNTQPYYNKAVGNLIPTDGNGIIIDINQSTNDGKPYAGRTLIMGNIVYNNGGSGIHAFRSQHVDMLNNTAYMNNVCPVPGSDCGNINDGQIFSNGAKDINIFNNVIVAPVGKVVTEASKDKTNAEDYNLYYVADGNYSVRNQNFGKHDIFADPQFSKHTINTMLATDADSVSKPNYAQSAFRPMATSPALNAGTNLVKNSYGFSIKPIGAAGNLNANADMGALTQLAVKCNDPPKAPNL